jgi:hypothetical protein
VSDGILIRRRFAIGDRAFTVLGEPWFDTAKGEWKGRFLFVPLDRSLPRGVASEAVVRAGRRDELVRQLGEVSDRELVKAFRGIALPLPRRPRER